MSLIKCHKGPWIIRSLAASWNLEIKISQKHFWCKSQSINKYSTTDFPSFLHPRCHQQETISARSGLLLSCGLIYPKQVNYFIWLPVFPIAMMDNKGLQKNARTQRSPVRRQGRSQDHLFPKPRTGSMTRSNTQQLLLLKASTEVAINSSSQAFHMSYCACYVSSFQKRSVWHMIHKRLQHKFIATTQ